MHVTATERKEALAQMVEQDLDALGARGVIMAGNAFSPVVLVKGELDEAERAGGELLAGADGRALRAALAAIEDFDTAMRKPGLIAHVLGRRVLALDGFEAALADPREKQRMWAYLKRLPPASAPY